VTGGRARAQVKDCIRYKYVVKTSEAGPHRWEDAIADRTINPERRPGQVFSPPFPLADPGSIQIGPFLPR
jgi:hypothetical protein